MLKKCTNLKCRKISVCEHATPHKCTKPEEKCYDKSSCKPINEGKKWTQEDIEKLEFLIKAAVNPDRLPEIFLRSEKSIKNAVKKYLPELVDFKPEFVSKKMED